MRMPSVLAFVLTFGVITHADAPILRAQTSPVAPGTKVRFQLRSGGRLEGRVVSLGPEALEASVPTSSATERYPLADIAKVEVATGRHRPVLRGVVVGTGAGVIIGAAVGAMSYSPCESTEFLGCLLAPESRAQSAAMGGAVAGILGLVVGGLQGLIPRERWQRVQVDGNTVRLNLRALPHNGTGIALALAL
ncbi:MAG TPA: hypothetical protein VJT85_09480 [Gemmatimonadaceae bacterium]|nr:hypothetical protein [Gemmatimonadaceae bacterium]